MHVHTLFTQMHAHVTMAYVHTCARTHQGTLLRRPQCGRRTVFASVVIKQPLQDSMCTTATSVTSDSNGSPRQTGGSLSCPAPIYVPPFVPPVALPIQTPAAATTALPPAQPSANQVMVSGEGQVSAQDLRTLQECGELLEVKQRSLSPHVPS